MILTGKSFHDSMLIRIIMKEEKRYDKYSGG